LNKYNQEVQNNLLFSCAHTATDYQLPGAGGQAQVLFRTQWPSLPQALVVLELSPCYPHWGWGFWPAPLPGVRTRLWRAPRDQGWAAL